MTEISPTNLRVVSHERYSRRFLNVQQSLPAKSPKQRRRAAYSGGHYRSQRISLACTVSPLCHATRPPTQTVRIGLRS